MLSNSKRFNTSNNRDDFDKNFNRTRLVFKIVFSLAVVGIIGVWCFFGFVGVKIYNELQENNGSVGTVIGKEYKAFQEASK